MGLIRQLLTGFRVDGEAEPGIIVKDDDTVWLVNPDGSLTQLPGSGGGSLEVTDGATSVVSVSEIDFTSGATVTDGGGGVAQVAVGGSQPGALCSQDFLFTETIDPGTSFAITAVDTDAGTVSIAGNHVALFPDGTSLSITGSTGNDGFYLVDGASFVDGATVLPIGPGDATVDGSVVAGVNLTASMAVPAGTVVGDIFVYGIAAWAADFAGLLISDVAHGVGCYAPGGEPVPSAAYDPTAPVAATNFDTLRSGAFTQQLDNASLFPSFYNGGDPSADLQQPRPGIPYASDDTLVLTVSSTSATPPDPAGATRIKVLYFAPVIAINAS